MPVHNLFATIYKACGIDCEKRYDTEGRKIKYASVNGNLASQTKPLMELF